MIHGMKHGHMMQIPDGAGDRWSVYYHRRQSHGDNGNPVRGAYTGEYTVEHEGTGKSRTFDHGPHATTEAARKKGANPDAKNYAARKALEYIQSARVFNDRRG